MGILNASEGSGGSTSNSYSTGSSTSNSSSYSNTYGTNASLIAQQQAEAANNSAITAWEKAAKYNAEQAQLNRDWQEYMANTTYQRTVADMKAAGINPILAASNGLSADSVSSGSTASMTTPEVYMANTYADQNSASTSSSNSESNSESKGSSWSESESGLATFLTQMSSLVSGLMGQLNSSNTVNVSLQGLENLFKSDNVKNTYTNNTNSISSKDTGSSTWNSYRKTVTENNKQEVGENYFLQLLNNLQYKASGLGNSKK